MTRASSDFVQAVPRNADSLGHSLSLSAIYLRFKYRITLTLALVVIETLLGLLYPLFIGWAVNGLLDDSFVGIYWLAGLGGASLIIASARRAYDTRIYAHVLQSITPEMVEREKEKGRSVSTISARSSLLTELVEFFENAMPEVVTSTIGVIGVLAIIGTLNLDVFFACLALLGLVALIYGATGKWNYRLNAGYNTEFERQVEAIQANCNDAFSLHLRRLMRWNVKLSDLETGTYFVFWLGVVALFVYSPIAVVNSGVADYGLILALLMYVFDFIEKASALPLYVQQVVRLKEVAQRVSA